jgi:glutathione S-transferase
MVLKLYCAWFCPYAQRAWISLEHHAIIDYDYIESLVVKTNQSEGHNGYEKNPRLLEINPKGLVPTIECSPDYLKVGNMQPNDSTVKMIDDSAVVLESFVCMEFINSIGMKKHGIAEKDLMTLESSMPDAEKWDKEICSVFYKVLMKPDPDEQKEAFEHFSKSLGLFIANVGEGDGGFYKSTSPTIVDYAIIPWILRIKVIKHFRPEFRIEDVIGQEAAAKLTAYSDRMATLPAVKNTMWRDDNELYKVYERYAKGTATSQVGKAVARGGNAHDK